MTHPGPNRIGIWCAVSTKPQAQKISLDEQERLGRTFAARCSAADVVVYRVPGQSRDHTFWLEIENEIPAYREYREHATSGYIQRVWMHDTDRCGRDPALSHAFDSIARKHGVELHVHTISPTEPAHPWVFTMQSRRAQEEQERRLYHHSIGMTARVNRGFHANNPPCGYDTQRNPAGRVSGYQFNTRITIVERITDLFLTGHGYRAIARRLDADKLPSAKGGPWKDSTIRQIVNNDFYAGYPSWAGQIPDQPSPYIPTLWTPETHAAVIRERQRRATSSHWIRPGAGPLTGIAICARCKGPMTRVYRSRAHYIRCGNHAHKQNTGAPCHPNNIQEHHALLALADHLNTFKDPNLLDQALVAADHTTDRQSLERDIERAHRLLTDLDQQRGRLAVALAQGKMETDIYYSTDKELKAQLSTEQKKARDLSRALSANPDIDHRRSALRALANTFPQLVETLEPAEVAQLLHATGIRILCENRQIIDIKLN